MERKFVAFQPVLVRNGENAYWKTAHYSNYNEQRSQHFADNQPWNQVIPYNESTAHLIGTTKAYQNSEKNNDYIYIVMETNYDNSSFVRKVRHTLEEAKRDYNLIMLEDSCSTWYLQIIRVNILTQEQEYINEKG